MSWNIRQAARHTLGFGGTLDDDGEGPLAAFFKALAVCRRAIGVEIDDSSHHDESRVVVRLSPADYRKFHAAVRDAWQARMQKGKIDVAEAVRVGIDAGLEFIGVKVEERVPAAQNGNGKAQPNRHTNGTARSVVA